LSKEKYPSSREINREEYIIGSENGTPVCRDLEGNFRAGIVLMAVALTPCKREIRYLTSIDGKNGFLAALVLREGGGDNS
jgi:hypothetical protein